ncbi:MAG: FAD-binding protein [Candidatus Lokiarchaeota archaeon]|nr:FAD-binding protein [Candidatus Lokiarchaeota archaeon]
MDEYSCDILIIGAGPAGLTAGVYCGRADRNTIILEGKEESALGRTKEIQNWIGEQKIEGPALLQKFRDHAASFENVRIIKGDVISLMLGMGMKNMISTRSANITADAVIIASGRGIRDDTIKGESNLVGFGVSYCALCDGPLYKDKDVFLYGKDEEMIEDALVLDQMGDNVNIITPLDLSELPSQINEAKQQNIRIIDNMEIIETIPGSDDVIEKIITKSTKNDEIKEFDLDCLFIFSHVPSNSIFKKSGIELDDKGNVKVDVNQMTNFKGVYAAGDVTGGLFQVVFAAAEGARAAINACKYVRQLKKTQEEKEEK